MGFTKFPKGWKGLKGSIKVLTMFLMGLFKPCKYCYVLIQIKLCSVLNLFKRTGEIYSIFQTLYIFMYALKMYNHLGKLVTHPFIRCLNLLNIAKVLIKCLNIQVLKQSEYKIGKSRDVEGMFPELPRIFDVCEMYESLNGILTHCNQ